jgi:tetratricopeptide (TPR) repeat protein
MATAFNTFGPVGQATVQTPAGPVPILSIPWREPHAVEPEQLQQYVAMLERACEKNPWSADSWTCLSLAHAMNHDLDRSMDALQEARRIDPENFFVQLKVAELHSRLPMLERAEQETRRAIELAGNAWELSLAREQLAKVRFLKRDKPGWARTAQVLAALLGGIFSTWK